MLVGSVGIAVILLIYLLVNRDTGRSESYRNQGRHTVVRNGVDVRKQKLGSEKGDYFTGNIKSYDTFVVRKQDNSVWKISFQNQQTGEMYKHRFSKRMWIGRVKMNQAEECLVISNDAKISKNHCVLYEDKNTLFLADMNSRNHTWLNNRQVKTPTHLQNGDVIRVGDTWLRIEFGK